MDFDPTGGYFGGGYGNYGITGGLDGHGGWSALDSYYYSRDPRGTLSVGSTRMGDMSPPMMGQYNPYGGFTSRFGPGSYSGGKGMGFNLGSGGIQDRWGRPFGFSAYRSYR